MGTSPGLTALGLLAERSISLKYGPFLFWKNISRVVLLTALHYASAYKLMKDGMWKSLKPLCKQVRHDGNR